MKITCFNRFGICAIAAACVWFQPGASAGKPLGLTAQAVQLAESDSTDSSLFAKLHVGRVFNDYEPLGFFRIGLLAVLVAENIKIQICSAACLTNALFVLRQAPQFFRAARRLEPRNLAVAIMGEHWPRLRVSRARIGNENTRHWFNVLLVGADGEPVSITEGALQIAGNSAGCLSWNVAGRTEELFLLSPQTKAL